LNQAAHAAAATLLGFCDAMEFGQIRTEIESWLAVLA
jgi:hypothetical protein